MKRIILASQSPRRRELMTKFNLPFDCVVADVDEHFDLTDGLEKAIINVACKKAEAVFNNYPYSVVIAADTIVTINNKILGKPRNEQDAFDMLQLLSGKTHKVLTGVCILSNDKKEYFCDSSYVEFYPLTKKQIMDYIATGEPMDKAGAYGIQGQGALIVKSIIGDFYSIMGFPIARVYRSLLKFI